MPPFNIEDAAFAGVGLLVRRPLAALAWALLWALLVAFVSIPFAGEITGYLTLVAQQGGHPSLKAIEPLAPGLFAFQILLGLGSLVVGAVISSAVFRAMLDPEPEGFAYLRLGDQEICVLLVNFVRGVIIFAVNIAMAFVLVALGFLGSVGGPAFAGALNVLGAVILAALVVWIELRLSLAGPMSFTAHKFRLFDSWHATRGMAGRLFLVGLIVAVIGLVVYIVLTTTGVISCLSLWQSGSRPASFQALMTQPASVWMVPLAPFIALISVLVVIGAAILTPVFLAPWAFVYDKLPEAAQSRSRIS